MIVLLIAKSVGYCINPSIYAIILHLKGLPFLDANPEPWMRNFTAGELADVKPQVVTLRGVEKAARIVDVMRKQHAQWFPSCRLRGGTTGRSAELDGIVLRAHLVKVLKKGFPLIIFQLQRHISN